MKDDPFDVIAKYSKPTEKVSAECDPIEGRIIAVEICSTVLEAHIWVALSDDFDPGDGLAVFYAEELALLRGKTSAELKEIHKTRLAFGPGSRVRQ
jgi:hypothetical protein